MGPTLKCGRSTQWDPIGENWFFFSVGESLVSGTSPCPLLLSPVMAPHLVWTYAGLLPSHGEFICASILLCLEGTVSLESSCLSFSLAPPSPRWRGLMKTSHLGLGVLEYLNLFTLLSCGSLCCLPSTARAGFSDDGWARHWSLTELH